MGFGEWYVYDWQSGSDIGGAEGQWGDDGDNFVSGEVVIINWSKLKCITWRKVYTQYTRYLCMWVRSWARKRTITLAVRVIATMHPHWYHCNLPQVCLSSYAGLLSAMHLFDYPVKRCCLMSSYVISFLSTMTMLIWSLTNRWFGWQRPLAVCSLFRGLLGDQCNTKNTELTMKASPSGSGMQTKKFVGNSHPAAGVSNPPRWRSLLTSWKFKR